MDLPDFTHKTHPPRRVAVVGAGLAGLSAAMQLLAHGHHVTIYEAAPHAGGRARGVHSPHATLDNGQHLCLGAYQATLALLKAAGLAEHTVFLRVPLALHMHDAKQQMILKTPRCLPAPVHLLWALCNARGLSFASKWQALRWMLRLKRQRFRLKQDLSVAHLLNQGQQTAQSIRLLWEPLCLAALNTPLDQASGQVFLNVLRDSFQYHRQDSDFLIARRDLSTALIEPLLQKIRLLGGHVQLGETVQKITHATKNHSVYTKDAVNSFDAVIVAVGPHQLKNMDMPALPPHDALQYQPITTVYLQFSVDTCLPMPVMGLCHGLAQWAFDRGQCCQQPGLLAIIISAHKALPSDKSVLVRQCITELNLALTSYGMQLPLTPSWSKVITEKRATFSCHFGLQRPESRIRHTGIFLAGDYVAGDYPATIEGAVRSGKQAAALTNAYLNY